jgi:hypothetical protein
MSMKRNRALPLSAPSSTALALLAVLSAFAVLALSGCFAPEVVQENQTANLVARIRFVNFSDGARTLVLRDSLSRKPDSVRFQASLGEEAALMPFASDSAFAEMSGTGLGVPYRQAGRLRFSPRSSLVTIIALSAPDTLLSFSTLQDPRQLDPRPRGEISLRFVNSIAPLSASPSAPRETYSVSQGCPSGTALAQNLPSHGFSQPVFVLPESTLRFSVVRKTTMKAGAGGAADTTRELIGTFELTVPDSVRRSGVGSYIVVLSSGGTARPFTLSAVNERSFAPTPSLVVLPRVPPASLSASVRVANFSSRTVKLAVNGTLIPPSSAGSDNAVAAQQISALQALSACGANALDTLVVDDPSSIPISGSGGSTNAARIATSLETSSNYTLLTADSAMRRRAVVVPFASSDPAVRRRALCRARVVAARKLVCAS